MALSSKISSFQKIVLIFFMIAMFGSVFYIMWKTISGIKDDNMDFELTFEFFENFLILFIAFFVIIIVTQFVKAFVVSRERKNAPPAYEGADLQNPMDYERRSVNHCPQCGYDLGKKTPRYCPECGYKVKNDFYHR